MDTDDFRYKICNASTGFSSIERFKERNQVKVFAHHVPMATLVELLADSILCFAAVMVAVTLLSHGQNGQVGASGVSTLALSHVWVPAAIFAGLMSLLYSFVGLYRRGAIAVSLQALFGRGMFALFMGFCVAYLALVYEGNGDYALPLASYVLPIMALGVVGVRSAVYVARSAALGARRVLIVGTGEAAHGVAAELGSSSSSRRTIIGFYPTVSDTPLPESGGLGAPVFSKVFSIDQVVQQHRIDEIIVAVREQRGGGVPMDQLLACRIRGIPVLDLAGFFERAKGEVPTDSLKASWLVYGHGFVQGGLRRFMKRAFDLISSSVLLMIASPIVLITALAIKLESPGAIIYRQERVGLGGRSFMCLKFRSMRSDAEKDGIARWAVKNDSRVTRVGALIRKMRIDEIPQLISVLKGEMSLVGPRPERPSFVAQLKEQIPFYDIRHSVKPGVTGWAQVRYSYGASVEDARRKHQFDLYYVKNNSLFLDLLVLVETVSVVLFREGAQ
jgi:sugar transferase (PEP-CTERM system associated)